MVEIEQPSKHQQLSIELSDNIFEIHDLIALGESEHGRHYDEIIACLQKYEAEIKAILLELPLNYQNSVEHFMTTGELREDLKRLLDGAKAEGKDISGILTLFNKAQELRKKIICYDPPKIQMGEYAHRDENSYYLRGNSRDEDMAAIIEQQIVSNPGKYLIIGGAGHFEGSDDNSEKNLGDRLTDKLHNKFKAIILPTDATS